MTLAWRLLRGYAGDPRSISYQALYNGSDDDGATYAIGAASSADGQSWTRYVSNPVISAGSGWESVGVKDPCLIWDGSQYVCYYAGFDGTPTFKIGRATAPSHQGPWTKYGSNPVISTGAGGSFRDAGVRFPTVLYEPADTGSEWKMWFGADKSGGASSIGYAHSSDGLSWTVDGQVLTVGTGWEAQNIYPGAIVKDGSTYYLFYAGQKNASSPVNWQGGYATFTSPTGTYTKGGGNPTLEAGFATVAYSQVLTSDTNSGSAVVHVASTASWSVGMPMLLIANDVTAEYHAIASIDSSTQVTLDSAVSSSFTTAHGATIRPFWFNSVFPRSVIADTMFLAAFQPTQGLTTSGETVWEGSMRATAASLTGTWTLDNASGLLLPLSPATSGWDRYSAENPSAIVAP